MLQRLFFLLNFILASQSFASDDPISLLTQVFEQNAQPDVSCDLYMTPILDSEKKLKSDLEKVNLYQFGTLTTEAGFWQEPVLMYNQIGTTYLQCMKTCSFEQMKNINTAGQAWVLTTHPAKELREIAFYHNLLFKKYGLEDLSSLHRYFNETLSTEIEIDHSDTFEIISNKFKSGEKFSQLSATNLQTAAISFAYDPINVFSTTKGLKKIQAWMLPKKIMTETGLPATYSLEDIVEKIATDKVYWRAAAGAAKKILKRIETGNPGGKLFDDLYSSFTELGLSESEAYNRTWDLIALYATRGASIGESLIDLSAELKPLAISMSTIGVGMNLLDAQLFEIGKNYSYPSSLNVSFDNGKPYHFWMTAYFARRLALEVGNVKSAALSAYLADLGYQMRSTSAGRDPNRFATISTFDPANNKIRLDLVYASAGARFGAHSATTLATTPFNLDEGLRTILEKATPYEPITSIQEIGKIWEGIGVRGYARWKATFAPDVLLHLFR